MIPLRYDGEGHFQAPRRLAAQLDAELVVGELRPWEIVSIRSRAGHNHYFACIGNAWESLPDALADELPSPEHLRKFALIKAGYCSTTKIVCASDDDAKRACALMKSADDYAVCEVFGRIATIYRALSQSEKAMGKDEFQRSKEAVLTMVSGLIGTDVTQLKEAV